MFKTGVDEWLRLCQLFTVLVLKHCNNVDVDVDEDQLPPLIPPASPAKGKAAKGKAAAAKGKAAIAKGVAEAAAASTDSQKGTCARKGFPAVESIKGLRLGDSAERGKSGGMPYACQLYADLVCCCLPCTEAHVVDNLLDVRVQFLCVNMFGRRRGSSSALGHFQTCIANCTNTLQYAAKLARRTTGSTSQNDACILDVMHVMRNVVRAAQTHCAAPFCTMTPICPKYAC